MIQILVTVTRKDGSSAFCSSYTTSLNLGTWHSWPPDGFIAGIVDDYLGGPNGNIREDISFIVVRRS